MKQRARILLAFAALVCCSASLAQTADQRVLWKFETGG